MFTIKEHPKLAPKQVHIVASGDLRESANRMGWEAQRQLEESVRAALDSFGWSAVRAHPYDEHKGHGFISTQRQGLDVFRDSVDPEAPLIVCEAVWQYSYHVSSALLHHKGPILTVANWSGQWPGLVGLLNLNASLTAMGRSYSSLWSVDFQDEFFQQGLKTWLETGDLQHDVSHVTPFSEETHFDPLGKQLAAYHRSERAVLGIFDEFCMGMRNASFPHSLLNEIFFFKENLSQSALVAEMKHVTDEEVQFSYQWLKDQGFTFHYGTEPETDLVEGQVFEQLRMYHAAARIGHRFGTAAIGIQYQQGLKDVCAASDLAEGLLNNCHRPPVFTRDESRQEINPGMPIVHFNEVDQGVAVDAVITNIVWRALGMDPATTLHDIRWGEQFEDKYVWVFEISGSIPASHIKGGYKGAYSMRQPEMYFPLGGGTLSGVSKPGVVVWSRVFIEDKRLQLDIGLLDAIELPFIETQRRLDCTTRQWPIMHAVLRGVTRDQLMAKHKSNHVNVVYADSEESALRALRVKATMFADLGVKVNVCGNV